MNSEALTPHLPFHDDELSQGYLTRNGYFHARVTAGVFCGYVGVNRADFRNGSPAFIDRMTVLAGKKAHEIANNTIVGLSDGSYQLRTERLGLPVVRRTFVRFCPHCLREDAEEHPEAGSGAQRFRWSWLLRPVVICAQHGAILAELRSRDQVKAFDLPKLISDHNFQFSDATVSGAYAVGPLQKYVEDRFWGTKVTVGDRAPKQARIDMTTAMAAQLNIDPVRDNGARSLEVEATGPGHRRTGIRSPVSCGKHPAQPAGRHRSR